MAVYKSKQALIAHRDHKKNDHKKLGKDVNEQWISAKDHEEIRPLERFPVFHFNHGMFFLFFFVCPKKNQKRAPKSIFSMISGFASINYSAKKYGF